MSSVDYDVVLNLEYDNEYRHYIPIIQYYAAPYYSYIPSIWDDYLHKYMARAAYAYYISLDDEEEISILGSWEGEANTDPPAFRYLGYQASLSPQGVYEKIYFRSTQKGAGYIAFTPENCDYRITYAEKANFNIQWNATGFTNHLNATFRLSTVWRNTYQQYEWVSATVYYKKTTDVNYTSVAGTVSGSWSDTTVTTGVAFDEGSTYDVYIEAVADDGTTTTSTVEQFATIDADAIATCISPSGVFTSGDITFVWSHATEYGTPQYAYDLQYSNNNGGSWTTVANHVVTSNTSTTTTISDAGTYLWRVRTYNTNDVAGEWASATFVNQVPANPPTNLQITTKGRPTVSWTSISQTAYQVQFITSNSVVYDSGAVYTSETSHFVNQYFNDTQSYVVRVRIYNGLGEVSEWTESGYQQPSTTDVDFTIVANDGGGATIVVDPSEDHSKYYLLRNNKLIAEITNNTYTDLYSIGQTNYSVVGVTSADQSDIQTKGFRVTYPHATLIGSNGQQYTINKRVDSAYEIQTNNQADINKANFIGDSKPTHYPSTMRLKSFTVSMFDDQNMVEGLLGTIAYYADNFNNGGWCMVTAYNKTDNFIKNGQGVYANEVSLTLEVTNYDDSIEYPI